MCELQSSIGACYLRSTLTLYCLSVALLKRVGGRVWRVSFFSSVEFIVACICRVVTFLVVQARGEPEHEQRQALVLLDEL